MIDMYELKRIQTYLEYESTHLKYDEIVRRLKTTYTDTDISLAFRCLGYKKDDASQTN